MRMYSMYFICKTYIGKIKGMQVKSRRENATTVYYIDQWQENSALLNELAQIAPLKEKARGVIESIPIVFRDDNRIDLTNSTKVTYEKALNKLSISMQTIMDAYEVLGKKDTEEASSGFDVKLPQFKDLGEFSKCLEDLNFIITQCPYLRSSDGQIKYSSVDIGSTWLTFLIVGAAASTLLYNLSKLVDMAVKIKSHVVTVRMQEEALRSIQIKNEVAAEVFKAFDEANKVIVDQCVGDLKRELGELENGEEDSKAQKSLEKLAYWMDRGLQVYSTIDASREIKDLFPQQADTSLLSDDLQRLIEMKKEEG